MMLPPMSEVNPLKVSSILMDSSLLVRFKKTFVIPKVNGPVRMIVPTKVAEAIPSIAEVIRQTIRA